MWTRRALPIASVLLLAWASGAAALQVGEDDFRISEMGPDGHPGYTVETVDVAYNSTDHEYLLVWSGDSDEGSLVENEYEIFAQVIDAWTGESVFPEDRRISHMGPDGDTAWVASCPAVAYNSVDNEYLVVWTGDDGSGAMVDDEWEIFGQLLNGESEPIAGSFRISDMGLDGSTNARGHYPDVVYNSVQNEYLVVWSGDDGMGGLADEEYEVFGQIVSANGVEVGTNDFRISDAGPDGINSYDAVTPALAYNANADEYLVVWAATDDAGVLSQDEYEIYCQRISGSSGAELGINDQRVSDMGPDGSSEYDATLPAVAYSSVDDEYLVVWTGDDGSRAMVDDEDEIFGERRDGSTAAKVGINDIRISNMGVDGDPDCVAWLPAVAYDSSNDEFLVVWQGADGTGGLAVGEFEVYAQRFHGGSGFLGDNDVRISSMGSDGDAGIMVGVPSLAFSPDTAEHLVVFVANNDAPPLVPSEEEVYGQFLDATSVFQDGFEIGHTLAWSAVVP